MQGQRGNLYRKKFRMSGLIRVLVAFAIVMMTMMMMATTFMTFKDRISISSSSSSSSSIKAETVHFGGSTTTTTGSTGGSTSKLVVGFESSINHGYNSSNSSSSDNVTSITSSSNNDSSSKRNQKIKREEIVGGDDRRACRVIIENKVDFHHEILESIVLRYPLPWDKYNCSSTKPVMFDFALFDNRFPNGMITCPEKKCPKHLNETEFVGWKRYFEISLQNRTFDRFVDGRTVQYHKLIRYAEYENSPLGPPDAVIDATCDIYQRFLVWLNLGKYDNYCVLHRECDFCEAVHYNKSCFLTPMWTPSQCTFLPSDLPRFSKEDLFDSQDGNDLDFEQTTRVCLFGRERNHTMWANVFLQSPYEKYNVRFVIGSRAYSEKRVYTSRHISPKALSFVEHERDYVEFHKRIAQCDILLPATDPIDRPAHFPPSVSGEKSKRKLTGSISQVVGYKIHSVMHHELERIYHDYFTAPVEVYGDSIQSKVDALTKMIATVAQNKKNDENGKIATSKR